MSSHDTSSQHSGPGGVPDGRPLGLPPKGAEGGLAADHTAGKEVPGYNHLKVPGPRRTSTETDNKNRDLADGAAIQGEWDRDGGAGMA